MLELHSEPNDDSFLGRSPEGPLPIRAFEAVVHCKLELRRFCCNQGLEHWDGLPEELSYAHDLD